MGLFSRNPGAELSGQIERLLEEDLDRAADRFAAVRDRLDRRDRERLAESIRRRLEGREHQAWLARSLAEGRVGPTSALELIETYEEAGYLTPEAAEMHRRHAFEAHRRELISLMASPGTERADYFQLLDGYRAAGYLGDPELTELEQVIEARLNPQLAARRLFAEAQVAVDPGRQAELLYRYLVQFQGFEDYHHAASQYLGLRIDQQWRRLHQLASARQATRQVQELNSLLASYLPHTSDLGEYVPIEQIVDDFLEHARDFDPEPGADDLITPEDIDRRVVVVSKRTGSDGSYEEDRNGLIAVGRTGRIIAASEDHILVQHPGPGFEYRRSWPLPTLEGTRLVMIPRTSDLALWTQEEVGPMNPRRPSPVFVHQYRSAVRAMADYLDRHREDHSPRLLNDQVETG